MTINDIFISLNDFFVSRPLLVKLLLGLWVFTKTAKYMTIFQNTSLTNWYSIYYVNNFYK
jgi:hypothetical protein